MTKIIEWHNCYAGDLKALIVPEAFAHPAKMSRKLCERIFDHGQERGYWKPGDIILDPFYGIGTTGLVGAFRGYQVIGVELEAKFIELAKQNNRKNRRKLERLGNSLPVVIQGDSRELVKLVGEAAGCVTSPPWMENNVNIGSVGDTPGLRQEIGGEKRDESYGTSDGQLGNLPEGDFKGAISSPPYISGGHHPDQTGAWGGQSQSVPKDLAGYGKTDGQIGQMHEGSQPQVVGGITSPPWRGQSADGGWQMLGKYAEEGKLTVKQVSGDPNKSYPSWDKDRDTSYGETPGQLANLPEGNIQGAISSPPYSEARIGQSSGQAQVGHGENYGASEGQLANMPEGELKGAITSPPYEDSLENLKYNGLDPEKFKDQVYSSSQVLLKEAYGITAGQLGAESGDTYWSAVAAIYRQVHALLPPGGAFAVVAKDFVRNKERVPLCDQTAELLEAIGFTIPERVRALLVKEVPLGIDMFSGEMGYKRKEKKSFFRRLAEKKGSPRIDWEEVIWAIKP